MNPLLLSGLFDLGKGLIDRFFPDPVAKAAATLELARMEHKHEIIIGILKDIASKYPNIRTEIMTRLQAVTTEAIVVGA